MLNIVLCDDNKEQRSIIKEYLKEILKEHEYNIHEFESGEELVDRFPNTVSIVLLDIQMKEMNGMEVARWIRTFNKKVEIIFLTGLVEYIQEGYEVRAYRYLMKPISFEEVQKHFTSWLNEREKEDETYLNISTKEQRYKIPISEINYIDVYGKDLTIYTESKNYVVRMSLDKIEEELNKYDFFRCHKSYLVNLKKVMNYRQGAVKVQNGEIPLSRYKTKEFKEALTNVLGDLLC